MRRCEVCDNQSDKTFDVVINGVVHVFDCFECAIQALAPPCYHCGCRVIGRGVEHFHVMYCCTDCAEQSSLNAALWAAPAIQ